MVDSIQNSGVLSPVKNVGKVQSRVDSEAKADGVQSSNPVDEVTLSPEAEEASILNVANDTRGQIEGKPEAVLSGAGSDIAKFL